MLTVAKINTKKNTKISGRKEEFLKKRPNVKLGYCAKVNDRSTIIGPKNVTIILPLE